MLRTIVSRRVLLQTRAYVHDPFNSSKPTSETHATEKTDKDLNVQSDAVEKGMNEKNSGKKDAGEKKKHNTRAPGPVIGMQDERGGKES